MVLPRFAFVACVGRFFKVEGNNLNANVEVPILNSDIFDCSRQKSCSTIVQTRSEEDENSDRAILKISKMEGL